MKTTFAIALSLLLSIPAFCQELPKNDEGIVTYTEVIQVEGKTKDQLLANAKRWMDEAYKSGKNRVVEDGTVSDNQNFKVKKGGKDAGGVNYDIRIMIKDGRYKFEITNLVHKDYARTIGPGGKLEREEPKEGFSQKVWLDIKKQADEQAKALIASLKEGMTYTAEAKSDDW